MKKSLFELAARYVLPSIRRLLVEELWNNGLSVREIAGILGISYSLVSRYLRGERGSSMDFTEDSTVRESIKGIAFKAMSGEADRYIVEEELVKLTLHIFASRKLCKYHKRLEPGIDIEKCRICPRVFG
ncbi:MAG: transcriptional regulator [Thermoprotei archaeon]|nr:MAG: transcriptional regulator [Thermoprotei archaeon]